MVTMMHWRLSFDKRSFWRNLTPGCFFLATTATGGLAHSLCGCVLQNSSGNSLTASTSIVEIVIWGASTVAVQLLVFRIVDLILHGLPERIQEGEMASATLLVAAKLATAIILAAAMRG